MKRFLALTIILFFTLILKAQEQPISYTQAHRDRMVRVETQVEAMQSQINRLKDKFDSYYVGLWLGIDINIWPYRFYNLRSAHNPCSC